MLARNYAKPFCIAGFVLGEIYMLLVVLAPYGHGAPHPLPAPIPMDPGLPAGMPIPPGFLALRIAASAIFFGPFGGLVGLGAGLIFSALAQWWRGRKAPAEHERRV